jgi:hypothetical protein
MKQFRFTPMMKWLGERFILSCGFSFLLATGASAQIVVQGVLQPDEVLEVERRAAELRAAERRARPWSLRLGASEVFESNVGGSVRPDGDLGSYLEATGGRSWTLPRGDIRVTGNVGENLYRRLTNLDQFFYGVGASASYRVSRRLAWNASDTLSTGYAQDAISLNDSALLPPKLLTHLNTASTGLSYELSPRTRLRWGIVEQRISVDSSHFGAGGTGLPGVSATGVSSSTLTTGINVGRQLSRSQTLGVAGEYKQALVNGTTLSTQGLFSTWQQALGNSMSVAAAGGMRLYTLPGEGRFRTAPGGSIGFTAHLRPDDSFGLRYDRSIDQALGNGTLLIDQITATYVLSLGRRLALNGGGNYNRGTSPVDSSRLLVGRTGTIAARCSLAQNLALAVEYRLYRRSDTSSPTISGYTTTASLTYGRTWR